MTGRLNKIIINMKYAQVGFTLIELLVVISVIGLLASVVLVALNGANIKARDTKRKADIRQIRTALDLYYDENGNKYPQAGACAYGTNCYVYSTSGANWIPALSPYMAKIPQDPKNNSSGPWADGHYSYSYGNVSANGQAFDLTAQLENPTDPDRCGVKDYLFYWTNMHWCTAFGGSYSNQIYESSP